jgi:hypothetical protein
MFQLQICRRCWGEIVVAEEGVCTAGAFELWVCGDLVGEGTAGLAGACATIWCYCHAGICTCARAAAGKKKQDKGCKLDEHNTKPYCPTASKPYSNPNPQPRPNHVCLWLPCGLLTFAEPTTVTVNTCAPLLPHVLNTIPEASQRRTLLLLVEQGAKCKQVLRGAMQQMANGPSTAHYVRYLLPTATASPLYSRTQVTHVGNRA